VADEAVYEYADFHVLTTTGNVADICQRNLPINVNNQDNDALFCSESEGVVRAIFDWDNRSIEPGGMGIRLTWLETVSQIGSRKKGGTACGSADETVAGRCANQLAHGLRAFVDMAGAGGPAIAGLNISNLKTLFGMFAKARKFNENISGWDTSAITDMQYLFQEAKVFNQDIGNWNTGAVKNMNEMFRGASVFNGDVSRWQTGSVTNMNYMFREATAFNQNIGTWDTANVTGMFNMFHKARSFNQNIGQWDTSKVTTMHRMFDRAESFNQDLSKWDIENVTAKSDFDTGATAWCGVNFDNRGRPDGVIPWDGLDCQIKILEANASNNFFGWTFNANPDPMDAGQAPVIGIADERGGDASLNFTLAGRMGNKRSVVLRQKHFENAGIEGVTQLKHLTSISWRAHHSKALAYPRFTVTLKANPITVDGFSYKKHESLHFKRKKRLNKDQWDTVTVDFSRGDEGSLFRHSGPLDEFSPGNLSTHQDRTIEQWIAEYGELEIASIRWAYGSKDNALASTSYIDYLEINGTIFDFEEGPPQPPGPPIDVVATPEDGQVSVAFAAAMPNSEPVTRYEYQLGTQDGAGNWSEGNWTSTGGTSSPFTITDLTNGTDYRVGLRAVSNAGEGEESSVVIFAPRKATSGIGLTVQAGSPRGFSLAGWTSDYVKDRSAVGIADGLGGNASINASLTGEGGDRWGVFLNPAQYKADVKAKEEEGGAYGGRKIDRLSDLTSLSFRVNHSGNGSYPRLGIQMARNTTADDGKTIAQLDVDMSQMEPLEAGWNLVTIDFDGTPIRSSYISATESSETKTLSEWIADYGDRRINLVRWQTGSGGGATMNTTYVDQIEVNGVTYDFEGLLPLPPSAPTDLVAQPGTEAGITFTFTPGDPGDSAIIDYQYSLNGDAGSVATWTSLGNIASPYQFVVSSGLTNGREDTLFLRAVSNSGVGESATVAFRPRADLDPITLTVDSTDARGFYLSSASSDYVKERDQAGIPDKNGGTTKSLNASLSNSGDVWRAEIKAEDLNAGGRVLGKLHDIESLSYEVWHDAKGNYPQLSILIERLDGERAEALYLQVNNLPLATTNAWNTVTVDPATSLFKNNNQNNSNDANAGATYTLNQWIAFYGDRPVKRIRWGGTRSVPSTTYLDFLEINGATYDFEAVPPAVIAPPPTIQSVTAGDGQATVSFSAGNNAGATVLAYEYQKDEGEEWTFTPDGAIVAPFTISDLTNGTTYILTMRTVSAGLGDETLESEASDSVSFIPIGQPLPPTNLSAEVGDQSAIVDFDNANTGNGAEITNYLISLDGGPFVALDPAISSGPITLTDLTNNQTYSVALKTQTGSGGQALFSEPSEILSFTPESGASVPDAPIDVALTLGDQQLSVSLHLRKATMDRRLLTMPIKLMAGVGLI
jgi:surface protein